MVYVLFLTMPEEIGFWTNIHVAIICFIRDVEVAFTFTSVFAQYAHVADRRVTSFYIACLFTINNMAEMLHRTYVFSLVDIFGLYYSQAALTLVSISSVIYYRKLYPALDEVKLEEWRVSDKFFTLCPDIELAK